MVLVEIDANKTPDRAVHDAKPLGESQLARVAKVAVPFLVMYEPTSMATSVLLGGVNIYALSCDEMSGRWEVVKGAYITASIALAWINPEVGAVVSLAVSMGVDTKGAFSGKKEQMWELLCNVVYSLSLYYRSTGLAVASLGLRGAADCKRSWSEFRKGKWIEGAGHLGLAAVRGYRAVPKVKRLRREWYGKSLRQEDLEKIFSRVNQERLAGGGEHLVWGAGDGGQGVDFQKILAEGEFSSTVTGLSFAAAVEGRKQGWSRVIFSDMQFIDCEFGRTDLAASVFRNCMFNRVSMARCDMRQILLSNCHFLDSSLAGALINSAHLRNVKFVRCRLRGTYFSHSVLSRVVMDTCKLYRSVFLGAEVWESKLVGCDLKDALLFDAAPKFVQEGCTEHVVTRPTVGISFKHGRGKYNTGEAERRLEELGVFPVRLDAIPRDIDCERLEREVKRLTAEAFAVGAPSVAAYVLARAPKGTEIARLRDRALNGVDLVDAMVLPGGLNMEREFQFPGDQVNQGAERTFRKSISEFALIQGVEEQGKRLLALCRGVQVFNVWRGGTLREVEGQMKVEQVLKLKPDLPQLVADRMHEIMGDEIKIVSMHKHAVERLGHGLHVLFEHDGVVKGLASGDGLIIALQPHPELASDWNPTPDDVKNHNFFRWLVNGKLTPDIAYTPPDKVEKM